MINYEAKQFIIAPHQALPCTHSALLFCPYSHFMPNVTDPKRCQVTANQTLERQALGNKQQQVHLQPRGTKQGHSPAKMLDFPELPPLWDYEHFFCSADICIPQHIYREINQDTSTKGNMKKRPVVLGAPRRKANGFLLCSDASVKSKPVTTYPRLKHDPLPHPV